MIFSPKHPIHLTALFLLALSFVCAGSAQTYAANIAPDTQAATTAQTAATEADARYAAAIEESYLMQAGHDFFVRVRDLYTKLPSYNPNEIFQLKFSEFATRLEAGDKTLAADLKAYSAKHLALPEIHSRTATFYKKLGDEKSFTYEMWLLKGLLGALMKSGDGHGPKTAYQVITVSEEYLIARNKIEVSGQSVRHADGHSYDILTGKSKNTGEPVSLWFNIDEIWASYP